MDKKTQIKLIVKQYQAGTPAKEIARMFSVKESYIGYVVSQLRKYGAIIPRQRMSVGNNLYKEVAKELNEI